ncbi:lectin like domain-containing protein [Methanoplanus limicola]|uniref:PKD domain containing protein n=1 Tax=Methanoplanus limicola DSM 2279 TaxID=937775 RepID=H1Z043_9EURY|nr:lectin like domain-containing protein [Methanoplanus limicola]EHQ36135.1 PKD domain containing protein [Methanoplanus limicola DSM 2279]
MNAINGKTIILSFLLILVLVVPAVAGTEDLGNDTGTDLEIQGDYSALAVLNDEDLVCDSCDSCSCAPDLSSGETSGDAANTAGSHPLGYIQPPNPIADRSPLDVSVLTLGDGVSIMADEPLPESYDLRVHGRMTPVKNQLDCGSCWAFAAYGSLESVLIGVEGDESDFSENNMKNKHGFDPGCCDGGSSEMAAAYLARWAVPDGVTWYSGPVSESDDPYDDSSCVSPDSLTIQRHVQDVYFLPVQSPADNSLVKSIIMDYGAVFAGFQVNRSQGFNMAGDSPAYYYNSSEGMKIDGGHGITIAGWDDSFSKDNFRVTPPGDGAYLIKNSWGSDWGNDSGYFYISYYDEDINKFMALFTAESTDNYDSVYYYDAFGATNFINMVGTTTSSFGNVFPSFGNETIRAAGVYTYQAGAEFEAEVHLNPDDGPENSTAGAVSYVNGTFDLPGYHTVDFETPVEISSDDTFSVIFTVTNPSSVLTIPIEQKIANYTSAATSAPGDSYYLTSNGHWADAYDLTGFNRPSICIKAYTTFGHVGPAPSAEFDYNRNFIVSQDNNTFTAGNYTSDLVYRLHAANMDTNTTLGGLNYTAHAENLSWIDYSAYATRINLTFVEWNFPCEYVIPGGSGFDTRAGTNFSVDNFYNHEFSRVCNTTIFRTPGVQSTNITVTFNDLSFESIFVGFAAAKDLNMTAEIISTSVVTDAPLAEPLPSGGSYHLKLNKGSLTAGTEYFFRFDTLITPNGSAVIHKPLAYVWEGMNHESADLGAAYKAEVPADMLQADEYEFSVETNTSCDWSVVRQNNLLSVLEGKSVRTTGTLSANFTASPLSGAAIRQVNFTDLSTGSPDTWTWDFGDGLTSSEQNPVHNYTSSGKYSVTLTVSEDGVTGSVTETDYITVYKKGDFNGNGFVDIGDVSKVAYMVADLTPVDMAADFNGNGEVDVGDAAIIAWYFVGKTGSL